MGGEEGVRDSTQWVVLVACVNFIPQLQHPSDQLVTATTQPTLCSRYYSDMPLIEDNAYLQNYDWLYLRCEHLDVGPFAAKPVRESIPQ